MNVLGPHYHQLSDEDLGLFFYAEKPSDSGDPEDPVTGITASDLIVYASEYDEEAGTSGTAGTITPTVQELDATNMPGAYILKFANSALPDAEAHWSLLVRWDSSSTTAAEFKPVMYSIYFREVVWSALQPIVQNTDRLSRAMARRFGVQ